MKSFTSNDRFKQKYFEGEKNILGYFFLLLTEIVVGRIMLLFFCLKKNLLFCFKSKLQKMFQNNNVLHTSSCFFAILWWKETWERLCKFKTMQKKNWGNISYLGNFFHEISHRGKTFLFRSALLLLDIVSLITIGLFEHNDSNSGKHSYSRKHLCE